MKPKDLSDNALILWAAHFISAKSTLSFGGCHAEMEITPKCREALIELLEIGAAKTIPPTDSWPGRECYGGTGLDLSQEMERRGIHPFDERFTLITFRKKQPVQ